MQANQNFSELISRHAVIIKQDSVDQLFVEVFARHSDAFAVTLAKLVILKTQSLAVDFVKDWQSQLDLFLAVHKVLDPRVLTFLLIHE